MDYNAAGCLQTINTTTGGKTTTDSVMTLNCIPVLIKYLINFGFAAGGTVALIFIIISGIKFIRSGGDPKETEGAKQTMTFAIIGLTIIILAAALVNFLGVITGATCISALGFNSCH